VLKKRKMFRKIRGKKNGKLSVAGLGSSRKRTKVGGGRVGRREKLRGRKKGGVYL